MKHPAYKRILSAVLAVVLLLSCVPGSIFANETAPFRVVSPDGGAGLVELPRNCRTVLTAVDAPDGADLQWQIAMPDDQGWVDISGQEEAALTVSIAMFASVMDENNTASIRCAAIQGESEYFTDPIQIQSTAPVMMDPPEETYPQVYEETMPEPIWEIFPESTEETTPETTVPETTVPETTVPEITVPETTVPETTVPETTVPETTVPETTVPETTVPETTVPEISVPETTIPETTAPVEDVMFEIVTEEEFSLVSGKPRIADNGGQPSSASGTINQIHTVTIDYYFKEEGATSDTLTPVWESFTATIEKGKPLVVKVPNKNVPGFGVWVEAKDGFTLVPDGTGSYIQVDIASVSEDISFAVYYKKVPVAYHVRYFLQNIVNDLYTEDSGRYTEHKGLAGDRPNDKDINVTIPGFTSLFYEPDFVAADGSTVFEVYYDRNYYLINFELDGGYGVEPIYARYEYPLHVGEPTKPGYRFAGWDLVKVNGEAVAEGIGTAEALPSTIPNENRTYKAIWETVNSSYTVVYWKADLDDGNTATPTTYSYWGQKTVNENSAKVLTPSEVGTSNPAKNAGFEGSEDAGYFQYESDVTAVNNPTTITVEGDGSTIVNVYYSRKEYTIRFVYARRTNNRNGEPTGNYYLADLTKCGAYNNIHDRNTTYAHGDVSWNYNVNENNRPIVTNANIANAATFVESAGTSTYTYYYISLTAQYGANIQNQWPSAPIEADSAGKYNFGSWGVQCGSPYRERDAEHANIVGSYPTMSADMIIDPDKEIAQTMVAWWGHNDKWQPDNISNHSYHIYYETLPGETSDREYNGNKYKLYASQEFTVAHNTTTRVDPFAYEGLTCINDTKGKRPDTQANSNNYANNPDCPNKGTAAACKYCNCFYYDRQNYTLSFFNHNASSAAPKSETLLYGESWSAYQPSVEPSYPVGLEPDAYNFEGWYTTPECYDVTSVDWNSTMPAGNVTVYAKWEPITRTIQFYDTYDHLKANTPIAGSIKTVKHGSIMTGAAPTPTHPQNNAEGTRYSFVGWFYMDENGQKVAFEPSEMEIRQDLKLYAEWKSPITTQYTISYKRKDTDEVIADDMSGYTFVATTKSFTAKAGTDLNLLPEEDKNELWLPETSSHSILMKETPAENVFTFYYVKKDKAPYKVRYLEVGTNRVLRDEENYPDNKNAIVTENFEVITEIENGKPVYYTPDAFYKQLTLSADDSQNVITFYYTRVKEDEKQKAPYQVIHYIQNEDGTTYSVYTEEAPKFADVDSTVSASPITINGYEYKEQKVLDANGDPVTNTNLPAGGLRFELYYDRKPYKYTVRYVDDTTNLEIALGNDAQNPVTRDPVPYNTIVTEMAITIPGYTLIGNETQTLRIGFEESNNVITFRYAPKTVAISYVPVCTVPNLTDFGNVMPVNQENLKVNELSKIQGATPLAANGFKFVGWYTEWSDVTGEVTGKIETDQTNFMKPVITSTDLEKKDTENKPYEFTYYALFEPIKQSLTITKAGAKDGDTFLFYVKSMGKGLASADVIVSIQGNGSVTINDLYCGEYSVQELTGWSWTYANSVPAQTVILTGKGATVTFTNTYEKPDWLHGESYKENQFS